MSNGIAHPDPPFRLATVVECSSGPAVRTVSHSGSSPTARWSPDEACHSPPPARSPRVAAWGGYAGGLARYRVRRVSSSSLVRQWYVACAVVPQPVLDVRLNRCEFPFSTALCSNLSMAIAPST